MWLVPVKNATRLVTGHLNAQVKALTYTDLAALKFLRTQSLPINQYLKVFLNQLQSQMETANATQ